MPKINSPTEKMLKGIYLMVYEGINKSTMSQRVGVDITTVSEWFKMPLFLEAFEAEMRRSFQEIAAEAKQTQLDLMRNAQSETVKANITKDFLSRAGYDSVTKTENTNREIVVELISPKNDEDKD